MELRWRLTRETRPAGRASAAWAQTTSSLVSVAASLPAGPRACALEAGKPPHLAPGRFPAVSATLCPAMMHHRSRQQPCTSCSCLYRPALHQTRPRYPQNPSLSHHSLSPNRSATRQGRPPLLGLGQGAARPPLLPRGAARRHRGLPRRRPLLRRNSDWRCVPVGDGGGAPAARLARTPQGARAGYCCAFRRPPVALFALEASPVWAPQHVEQLCASIEF